MFMLPPFNYFVYIHYLHVTKLITFTFADEVPNQKVKITHNILFIFLKQRTKENVNYYMVFKLPKLSINLTLMFIYVKVVRQNKEI